MNSQVGNIPKRVFRSSASDDSKMKHLYTCKLGPIFEMQKEKL